MRSSELLLAAIIAIMLIQSSWTEPEITVIAEPTVQYVIQPEAVIYGGEYQTFEMTAYTAGPESTGKTPDHPLYGITASGKRVQEWHTIACPHSVPFNTRIYIPHFNRVFTCEDRGSAIIDGRLDIYMPELSEALTFGRQQLTAFVLPKE